MSCGVICGTLMPPFAPLLLPLCVHVYSALLLCRFFFFGVAYCVDQWGWVRTSPGSHRKPVLNSLYSDLGCFFVVFFF